jgi:hypothetical protein
MDLRNAAHSRDVGVSETHASLAALTGTGTGNREQRLLSELRFPVPGSRFPSFYLIPNPVQLLERRLTNNQPPLRSDPLDLREAPSELRVRPIERERRVNARLSTEIHDREQQIA